MVAAFLLGLLPTQAGALPHPATPALSVAAARSEGWVWPVPSQRVVHGFDLPAQPWLPGHRGVDLAAGRGSSVRSAGAGTVVYAGTVGGVPVVTVAHADGLRTTYQPVTATVRAGDQVDAGGRIGTLAVDRGHCRPRACLHWGLLRGRGYLVGLVLVAPVAVRLLPLAGGGT
jgi:murein DD-endopeptidase MepM/ murein hydrolase activator NlpD